MAFMFQFTESACSHRKPNLTNIRNEYEVNGKASVAWPGFLTGVTSTNYSVVNGDSYQRWSLIITMCLQLIMKKYTYAAF